MLPRPGTVLIFDAETTGTDRRRDQIIELCAQLGLQSGAPTRVWRFRPDVPMSPGAQEVHGITMEELADCPRFEERAEEVRDLFQQADVLVGYNLAFDIEMLQEEYRRAGQPALDLAGVEIVDAFRLWQKCEPRSLQDAHRRFVGGEFDEAHSARADVAATGRVLSAMLEHFRLPGDWSDLARVCEPDRARWIGPSRHIQWEEGRPVLGFGKHRGKPLVELARGPDAGYLLWILEQDFPPHVTSICRRALDLDADSFARWLERAYGNSSSAGEERPAPGVRRAVF